MSYLIGTDEAGYGPNLGPLVVAASVWQAPDDWQDVVDIDLYDRLQDVICRHLPRGDEGPSRRLVVADSKALFKPPSGLGNLECSVLAALAAVGRLPTTWQEVWQALCPDDRWSCDPSPWHTGYEAELPLSADAERLRQMADGFRAGLGRHGVRLIALGGRAVFPGHYNDLLAEHGNKSDALSAVTLDLLAEVMAPLAERPIAVVCDKHGGRNHYGALLQRRFPDWLVEVHGEGRAESRYCFGPRQRRVTVCFRSHGETAAPTALASMTAKYLRELAMRAFNDFWRREVPHLRPTAGYPVDARRFRREIGPRQAALGIADRTLWRVK